MKRILFFRVFLPCALLSLCLTGCREGIDGPSSDICFVLFCTDDLLEFATPIAKFKDERDIEQNVVLSVDSFIGPIVDYYSYNGHLYLSKIRYWQCHVIISGSSASRAMEVSYRLRDDAPEIQQETTYLMYHTLESASTTSHPDGSGKYVFEPLSLHLDVTLDEENFIKGVNLEGYLKDLLNNHDYKEETVGK